MASTKDPLGALEKAVEGYSDEEKPLGSYAALIGLYNVAFVGALVAARASGRALPERLTAGDLVLYGTATHKFSRLVSKVKVTAPLRAPFTRLEGSGGPAEVEEKARGTGVRRAIGELILCPYCLDQWVATAFVSGGLFAPRVSRLVAGVFATVAIADFLQIAYKAGQGTLEPDPKRPDGD